MKILLLGFEGENYALANLAGRLKRSGLSIYAQATDHWGVTHDRGEFARYFRRAGLTEDEFGDLESVYVDINRQPEDLPESAVDWKYLRSFEERYPDAFTLRELIETDTIMSQQHHHRTWYYVPENKALLMKYLELQCRFFEELFERHRFDCVFSIGYQLLPKALVYKIARGRGIPYVISASCRIRDLFITFDNFSFGAPASVREEMRRLRDAQAPCADAEAYFGRVRKDGKPSYDDFEAQMADIQRNMSVWKRVKELPKLAVRFARMELATPKYRGNGKSSYFLPTYFRTIKLLLVALARRIGYFRHPELIRTDLPTRPFVYFALHLMPENTTLTLCRTQNEKEAVYQLAKALPVDWEVLVKVNPSMLANVDTHPNSYYLAMSRFTNVRFISPAVPSSRILPHASAVAALSGTVLLEGAVMGKPGFRWGWPEFEPIDTIHEFDPARVAEHLAKGESANIKYYIQACCNLGYRVAYNFICSSSGPSERPEEYERTMARFEREILDAVAKNSESAADLSSRAAH